MVMGFSGALQPDGGSIKVLSIIMVSCVLTRGVRQLGSMCSITTGDGVDVGLSEFALFIVVDMTVAFLRSAYV